MRILTFLICLLCVCCSLKTRQAIAQDMAGGDPAMQQLARMQETLLRFETLLQQQNDRIATLEKANAELHAAIGDEQLERRALPPAQIDLSGPLTSPATPRRSNLMNPEIGVVADVVANITENSLDEEGKDRIAAREVEFVYGAFIDPYSRLDVVGGVGDFEAFQLEEAYITRYGLPYEVKGEVGRFFPKIGKAASVHRDALDTVDEPLVVARYFGEEGYFRTGAAVTKAFDVPWNVAGEIQTGILEGGVGDGGTAFGSSRRRPTFFTHGKLYKECTDATDFEFGATHLAGSSSGRDRFDVNILGFDATLNHKPTPESKIKWQSEAYLQNRRHNFYINDEGNYFERPRYPWGFYSLLDYRINPRWEIGARADAVQPVNNLQGNRLFETAWSAFLTYHQSEFARWRVQLRHTDFAAGGDDNAFFLQGTVAIGQHKHKLQ